MMLKNIHAHIIGVGAHVPKKRISNKEVIARGNLDTTDKWIREHAGIAELRVLGKGESNVTMGLLAARRAIKNAKISSKEIGLVVVGSETAEQYLPAAASLIRDELGLVGVPAFDVNTACASFMTGFAQAALFLEHNSSVIASEAVASETISFKARNEIARLDSRQSRQASSKTPRNGTCALVIGVDSLFEHQDPKDRDSVIIFGDGAGAVVLSRQKVKHTPSRSKSGHPSREGNIVEIVMSSVPGQDAITNPLNGYFKMDRTKVKENILELVLDNLSPEKCKDIDHFFFHQASKRVLDDIADALKIPMKKIHSTLWKHGNTGAASIPLTLDRTVRQKKIRKGDRVLLCGFGAGYEYVHVLMLW